MGDRMLRDLALLGRSAPKLTWPTFAGMLLWLGAPPLFAAAPVVAFPDFDIQKSCASAADKPGCILIESQAKADLEAKWAGLSRSRKAQCKSVGEREGYSYVAALGCASSK